MADLKIDIASVFSGKKAFTDAAKSTLSLQSQVKSLAKSYAGLFTAQRLARSSFNAVKAFAADDKAARVLSRSLDNLGLAFADPSVRSFIAELEKTFGVLDDQLRPAFQRLLTTTGDVAKSQSLLRTALNLSAASGVDVVSVAGDLSKGYVGQTRALAKYGIGLTQAQLKAMSFEEVQTRINILFGGQAQLAANTYSGSLDKLAVASNNAKEAIGKGLVDALSILGGGGEGGLQNTIKLIERASTALETFIRRFGVGVAQAKALLSGNLSQFVAIGQAEMNRGKGVSGITPAIAAELNKAAAEKASAKARAALTKTTKAQTAAIKEQTALQKAGTLFDLQQTSIIAALKGQISDDERKRLELQLAILTGNTTEASKLAGQLATSQGLTKGLVDYLKDLPKASNPFSAWAAYLDAIEAQVKRIAIGGTSMGTTVGGTIAGGSMASGAIPGSTQVFPGDFGDGGAAGAPVTVVVNVAGSVVSEGELVDVVRNGLINSSLSGAGSLVARRTGTFATL
tara:strand:+ start:975 stop:2516 length:1542 start_codon:yes stop_codon:yes gene_type:complete